MSQIIYLAIFLEADSEEEALDTVSSWVGSLPEEHSGVGKGFEHMVISNIPITAEDAANFDNDPLYLNSLEEIG